MGRNRSLVWQFFERILEGGKAVAVECKLCETEYKYFGNTTNLKQHLVRRHPIQWEISENGGLHETARKRLEEAGVKDHDPVENSDIEHETDTASAIAQEVVPKDSDEEWLEEQFQTSHIETYEVAPKRLKPMKIKKERDSPAIQRRSRLQSTQNYEDTMAEQTIIMPAEPPPVRDELSVFGEYIANKMRKFKSPRTRGNLQQVITTMLWQAEYGVYDNSDAVKRILMMPVETQQLNNDGTSGNGGGTVLQEIKKCYQEIVVNNECGVQNDSS